jgi:excisionase family DNA binding protein
MMKHTLDCFWGYDRQFWPIFPLDKPTFMASRQPEIMTLPEVADYLKVAERTLYRLAASKKIPAFKVGGAWRFTKSDIEAWIRSQVADKSASTKEH